MKIIIQIVILGLFLGGCKTLSRVEPKSDSQTRALVQRPLDITEKRWKLIEINGKPVASDGQTGRYGVFIMLYKEEKRVTGSTGCNAINGFYEINPARNQIKFLETTTTLMACQNMALENELNKIFALVDNYTLSADGKFLSLNQAQMAPLARFQVITPE